jgi:glycosyltransferase involved in cell wall biosynthesis
MRTSGGLAADETVEEAPAARGESAYGASASAPRLGVLLWSGELGGAELVNAAIARVWRDSGVDATFVIVTRPGSLTKRLEEDAIPFVSVGLERGRDALLHPRRVAQLVSRVAPDGVIVVDDSYLAAVLRVGGYRGRIVGAEHGKLLLAESRSWPRRLKHHLERAAGAPFRHADVGVSDFMVARLRRRPHARRVSRIYNGVDPEVFFPAGSAEGGTRVSLGCAVRLVPGKGVDQLVRAMCLIGDRDLQLRVAGEGPQLAELTELSAVLGVASRVRFVGRVYSMPEFWRAADIAIVPSDTWVESFSMSTLEAMATGIPVVATAAGGLPEVVAEGETGALVPPGDPAALAAAITRYADDPDLRRSHGNAARRRALETFSIAGAASRYLELFELPHG